MNLQTKKNLFFLGFPFSPFYANLMKLRSFVYKKNILKSHKLPIPVISVGNLTMGGSGKTPLVIYLADLLTNNGYKPAVISRGYRGKSRRSVNIVSDAKTILMDSLAAGDEPVLIASSVPNIVVATGKKRIQPCQKVIADYHCDVIILDDGFQHLAVHRDLDLVLFDTTFFAGNSRVFPGGDLREPVSALNRCDAFVLTGVNRYNIERAERCEMLLRSKFQDKTFFNTRNTYKKIFKYSKSSAGLSKEVLDINQLPENATCFCGIANPDRFKQSITDNSISISNFITYPDHHYYTEEDITFLNKTAAHAHAEGLLTTEKDITKLFHSNNHHLPIFTLPLEVKPDKDFDKFIIESLQELPPLS